MDPKGQTVVFLDWSWPQVTESMGSETVNNGGLLYLYIAKWSP